MKQLSGRWQKVILHLMGKEDPPEKVAAAFALGVAISFTPFIGFHSIIALGLALLLRLSKVDVLIGTLVVNPWTMVPIFSFEHYIGKKVLRYSPAIAQRLPWREILHRDFWHTLHTRGWHDFAAILAGAVFVGGAAAAVTYFAVRAIILRYERTHPHLSARLRKTGEHCLLNGAPPKEPAKIP